MADDPRITDQQLLVWAQGAVDGQAGAKRSGSRNCSASRWKAEPTVDEGQVLVEWDWVYAKPRYRVLHHVTKPADAEGDEDWPVNGYDARSACGLLLRGVAIPGVFSRMGCPRCSRCCDWLGYPRGVGSPKNDDECRPLVAARVARLTR